MTSTVLDLRERGWLMDPQELLPLVRSYTEHLAALGHTPLTVTNYTYNARHFAAWLCQSGIALADVDDGVMDQFAQHRCQCPGYRRHDRLSQKYIRHVRLFVRFLVETGAVPAPAPQSPTTVDPRILAFEEWLRLHRGVSEATILGSRFMLAALLPALGADPATYHAELVRRVILDKAGKRSRAYITAMSTTLRQYLKFLAARGECPPHLDQAVPAMAGWSLSALPRYLPAADVERLIASCNLETAAGIRDRAILLLLARLGLRAGDIVGMRLDDVEWAEGTLRVRGKGRREVRLPLPQDAGDAMLDYLNKVRPSVACDHLFLRVLAPHGPFKGPASISKAVHLALTRAGITDAPSRGAHQLRHSAATGMLRAGASLDAIGTVLRHRSVKTTAHYAKVDVPMLRQIAQPWPGDVPC